MRVVARPKFEQHDMVTIEWHDRPMWGAQQVAAALLYSDTQEVVRKARGEWSDELVDGTDYTVLRGADLAALKAAVPDLVSPNAPALMLLTESGVNLVAILSRQPKAKALRRWLAEEVLPSIRRTGGYRAELVPAAPTTAPFQVSKDLDTAKIDAVRALALRTDMAPRQIGRLVELVMRGKVHDEEVLMDAQDILAQRSSVVGQQLGLWRCGRQVTAPQHVALVKVALWTRANKGLVRLHPDLTRESDIVSDALEAESDLFDAFVVQDLESPNQQDRFWLFDVKLLARILGPAWRVIAAMWRDLGWVRPHRKGPLTIKVGKKQTIWIDEQVMDTVFAAISKGTARMPPAVSRIPEVTS